MRYPLKFLQRAGLVSTLLIGGVLGGLIAPLSSEAVNATTPTVTIEVTSTVTVGGVATTTTTTNSILLYPATDTTYSTCPSGFNYCFGLHTYATFPAESIFGSGNRKFKVSNYPNAIAKLQIADYPGTVTTAPLDKIVLTGVAFIPVCPALSATEPCPSANWPHTEQTTLKIIVTHKLDAQPNTAADGTSSYYLYGITTGGTINSSYSAVGDIAQIYGKGTFVTTDVNGTTPGSGQPKNISNDQNPDADLTITGNSAACTETTNHVAPESPLCRTVASPVGQISFSYGQSSSYYPGAPSGTPAAQRFACTNTITGTTSITDPLNVTRNINSPNCQPNITLSHLFTLKGPDTVNMSASSHSGGGVCGPKPLRACECNTTKSLCEDVVAFIVSENGKENALQGGIPAAIPCSPDICNGTLKNTFNITPEVSADTIFTFIADGPRVKNFPVTILAGTSTINAPPFERLITGHVLAGSIIFPDYANWPRPDSNSFYQVDQIKVTSANGSTIVNQSDPNADVRSLSCTGGNKGPLIINAIGQGDTLTVTWHIHNSQSPPAVCPY